jgi:hypothetical protein
LKILKNDESLDTKVSTFEKKCKKVSIFENHSLRERKIWRENYFTNIDGKTQRSEDKKTELMESIKVSARKRR